MSTEYEKLSTQLAELAEKFQVIDKKFYGILLAGVVFWGGTQYFLQRELRNIDTAIQNVQANRDNIGKISGDVNLLKYQQTQQDRFNVTTTAAFERQKEETDRKFRELESRIYSTYLNPNSNYSGE